MPVIGPGRRRGREDQVSVLFSVLASEHCRQVLEYFRSSEATVATVEELVEYAVSSGDSPDERERRAVEFHHETLPKVADAGILEYDTRNHHVRYDGHDGLESRLDGTLADGRD